jgi:hypothetical protein
MQEPDVPVEEEWVQEQKLLPQEYWEEEPVERVEYKTVTEERAVPQVKALYAFQGQDIDVAKGEVLTATLFMMASNCTMFKSVAL